MNNVRWSTNTHRDVNLVRIARVAAASRNRNTRKEEV
jgi:hypothetical protein